MSQMGQHSAFRPQDEEPFSGGLSTFGGIVSATIAGWAQAAGTSTQAVEAALADGVPTPLMDTARPKGRKKRERPRDPQKRSVAFAAEQADEFFTMIENA